MIIGRVMMSNEPIVGSLSFVTLASWTASLRQNLSLNTDLSHPHAASIRSLDQ